LDRSPRSPGFLTRDCRREGERSRRFEFEKRLSDRKRLPRNFVVLQRRIEREWNVSSSSRRIIEACLREGNALHLRRSKWRIEKARNWLRASADVARLRKCIMLGRAYERGLERRSRGTENSALFPPNVVRGPRFSSRLAPGVKITSTRVYLSGNGGAPGVVLARL